MVLDVAAGLEAGRGRLVSINGAAGIGKSRLLSEWRRALGDRWTLAFLAETERRKLALPGMFGVFYYRSQNPKTLETLREFLPVPVAELREEFATGATPDAVCARSIRELSASGVKHFYVSNLPIGRAAATLARILTLV